MIAIPVESQSLAIEFLQVTFGASCSFGLQFSSEAKTAAVNLFPMTITEEVAFRSHRRTVESQVYSNHIRVLGDSRFRDTHDCVQPELPVSVTQVSRRHGMAIVLGAIRGNTKGYTRSALNGREARFLIIPMEDKSFLVVAYWTEFALWAFDGLEDGNRLAFLLSLRYSFRVVSNALGLPRQGRFHRFGRLDTCLNEQVRDQARAGSFSITIGGMMQLHPIAFLVLPSISDDRIEGISELLKGFLEGLSLLWRGMQLYLHCSVHTESRP